MLRRGDQAADVRESGLAAAALATDLYRRIYGRNPTEDESALVVSVLNEENGNRRESIEDLMWAMINTPEFVYQD